MKLAVFDFDNTLIGSDVKVVVKSKNKPDKELSCNDFCEFNLAPDENFDFSQFDSTIKNPKVILENFKHFLTCLQQNFRTVILTARKEKKPIQDFLKYMSVKIPVEIIPLDGASPDKKRTWIEEKIQEGYNDIFFVDDSQDNVEAVLSLRGNYPEVEMNCKLFTP